LGRNYALFSGLTVSVILPDYLSDDSLAGISDKSRRRIRQSEPSAISDRAGEFLLRPTV
jgi:hypothetical protein